MHSSIQTDPHWYSFARLLTGNLPIPSPLSPRETISLYNIIALCVSILSCSSTEDTLMHISPPLQKTDESLTTQHSVKVRAKEPAWISVYVEATLPLHPSCFHWFRGELSSVYVNEVAFKHMPRTIILKQLLSCTKTRPCSEWVKYLATNIKPSWGDRGEMSQLACHLACQSAHGRKRDTGKSLCTFNEDRNNNWYQHSIKEHPGDDEWHLDIFEVQQKSERKRSVKCEFQIKKVFG